MLIISRENGFILTSELYVRNKAKRCKEINMISTLIVMLTDTSETLPSFQRMNKL